MTGPDPRPVSAGKAALRERMLLERAALSAPTRTEASSAISRRLRSLTQREGARTMLAYASVGTEVDLHPFLLSVLAAGTRLCLPWVDGADLRVAQVRDLDMDLAPGWRGVREPRAQRRREVDPLTIDAVVAPGLAFDRHGHRLGYGGGHFDRLLTRLRPGTVVIGVAFDVQLVDAVPVEAHDVAVDAVVTESGIIRPGA